MLICVARLGLSGRLLVYFCAVRVSLPGRLCWRASRPLPNPRGAHGNLGPARWNRLHADLSAGRPGITAGPSALSAGASRRKRTHSGGLTDAAASVTTRRGLAYNERGPGYNGHLFR